MKLLVLTGCNGQIGQSIISKLNNENWFIIGVDVSQQSPIENYNFDYVRGSVSEKKTWESVFKKISQLINDEIKHMSLINNAGIAVFTPSEERTIDEFNNIMQTNFYGPVLGMTSFFEFLSNSKICKNSKEIKKSIVNIASIYGNFSPNPSIYENSKRISSEVYGASKAALIQATKYFAIRYGKIPIAINSLSPGGVLNEVLQTENFIKRYSELVPQGRMCEPEEVAEMINGILKMPIYCTGQNFLLDGGMSSW
tara:strand:+ start:2028 stop:2789 length:762 start_codon:yes stop_codon:yes gene_type:complete